MVLEGNPEQASSGKHVYVIGVNYASFKYAEKFVKQWSSIELVKHIILVDNFSTEEERARLRGLGKHELVTLLELPNAGYGSALNSALRFVADNLEVSRSIVLFGNVDVEPVSVCTVDTPPGTVPQIVIWEGRRNRNPFMTSCQAKLLGLYGLAAKRRSRALLKTCIIFNRFLAWFPCRGWAVHGSMFAIPGDVIHEFCDVFSEEVFLYCEELFFALRVMSLEMEFTECGIAVRHIGGVSTGPALQKNTDEFFANWCRSMEVFTRVFREQTNAED